MLKPVARAMAPSTTKTKNKQVMYTPAMSLPSATSDHRPYLPTVNAMAPNAPSGARRMMSATTSKRAADIISMISTRRCTLGPSRSKASPNNTENSSTCSTSPRANPPTMVSGMTLRTKSTVLKCCEAVVYAATELVSAVAGSKPTPTPGFSTVTTTRPMSSATVDTTSK